MSKKINGPEKAGKMEKHITFNATRRQYSVIQRKAAQAALKTPEFLRQRAINGQVKPKWTFEERDMVEKLVEMLPGIHQLAETARKEGVQDAVQGFGKYREQIDIVHKRLRDAK